MRTKTSHPVSRVLDFGWSPEELAAEEASQPRTVGEIAASIVSEEELSTKGRWGGNPAPRWRRSWRPS